MLSNDILEDHQIKTIKFKFPPWTFLSFLRSHNYQPLIVGAELNLLLGTC